MFLARFQLLPEILLVRGAGSSGFQAVASGFCKIVARSVITFTPTVDVDGP